MGPKKGHKPKPAPAPEREGIFTRIGRSVIRGRVFPRNDGDRRRIVLSHLILHMRPARMRPQTLRYTHTWGLGGTCLVLFTLLALTGVLLVFVYEPSPGRAYASIASLEGDVLFGRLVRNIHHWSANFLVAVAVLHLLRVFLTGAFHGKRQFNWVIGLMLLLGILAANFTGYLLPWDQLSYWAITICTGMLGYVPGIGAWLQEVARGGPEIGRGTLTLFYAIHTTVVPVLLIGLMAWHFWRVRKAGGVVVPPPADDDPNPPAPQDRILVLPNLLLRELVAGLVTVAFVMVFALFVDAPLTEAANPGMSPNPARAPWYFVGFQELLLHFHPWFAVLLIPLAGALALVLVPYLKYDSDIAGRWFLSDAGRRTAVTAAIFAAVVTPVWIVLDELVFDPKGVLPGLPAPVSDGLLPAALLLVLLSGFVLGIRKKYKTNNNESRQAVFVLLAVAFLILTLTGALFRGPGMALTWPW
jgi:quinol-cytochrome oxidoreductase complex cytochrome b subunit